MNARVKLSRRHADIGGRRSKPALGRAYVGTAFDQCLPVADGNQCGEMRRRDTGFETVRCLRGGPPKERRQLK